MAPLLDIGALGVDLATAGGSRRIVDDLSLRVGQRESVGIVGESGSGKTILIRAVLGLLDPPLAVAGGSIAFDGRELVGLDERRFREIRGRDIALTTPEPRKHLNPLLTVGRQIANVIRAHRDVAHAAAAEEAIGLLRAVGIPDPERRMAAYPHELSGGMCQRVIIAMALAHRTRLLLVDEPTAGLDVTISRQILDLMHQLAESHGTALVLVSRDLGVVAHYCRRVAVMYAGRIVEDASVAAFFERPVHPYSRQLLRAAVAARDGAARERRSSALLPPAETGCAFRLRCPVAVAECAATAPPLAPLAGAAGHAARCLRAAAIAAGEIAA
ncbi:MAG: ABC transporter ATP-binding protein [Alphaproteobacteria bacterium]|nr:ABC transporter ATP-binding protein [Alphaproteobacteria bacterium]